MTAVAIFVKTPGFSPVKTRLAAGLGTAGAEAFHRRAARAVGSVATVCAYWAVAEAEAMAAPAWAGKPRLWQGEGGLGLRMARVYDALRRRHGSALLIGADTPQTTLALLAAAADALAAAPFVVGPATDGGFWLFGGRRAVPDAAWQSVTYSAADTCRQFLSALAPLGQVASVAEQVDADLPADLPRVLAALQALPAPTVEQRDLAAWLAGQLG